MIKKSNKDRALSLFTQAGERKYLSSQERERFFRAVPVLSDPKERTFCETLYWTGCRPSEALDLKAIQIDVEEDIIVFRSAKKLGAKKGKHFRPVPVPNRFMKRLNQVHGIRAAKREPDGGSDTRLWTFSRTTAWKRTRQVMQRAGITGIKASAKGLRHAFGVLAAMRKVPETRIKTWLGHESLATTEIYIDVVGAEDRALAARLWGKDVR